MRNIFVISASHHFMQVEKCINDFNLDKRTLLIIILCTDSDEEIFELIVKEQGFDNIIFFRYWTFKEILSSKSYPYIKYIRNIPFCENLYISQYYTDYTLLAYNILRPEKTYLLDEGTASFRVIKDRRKKKLIEELKLTLKSVLYGRRIRKPKRIIFYTQYNLEKHLLSYDSIIKYTLQKSHNKLTFDKNSILIIGSSVCEVGIVKLDNYLHLIDKIIERNAEYQIYYYPHRKENISKINKLKNNENVIIIDSVLPFEFYFKNLKLTAYKYYSFYSPVLHNLSIQYISLPDLYVVKLDPTIVLKNHAIISDIYLDFERNKSLKVIAAADL